MELLESGQMYLETILVLSKTNKQVRSIDISNYMNFSKPSISRAVNKLKDDKFINIDNDGVITFTPKGKELAEKIYERHNILTKAITSLGVSEEVAQKDACKIEHDISDETFNAIKNHFKR